MTIVGKYLTTAGLAANLACAGCAIPRFDVPYSESTDQPTITSILGRVKCELTKTVSDPFALVKSGTPSDIDTYYELFLLNGDYDVQVTLNLEVNNTGGLTPSITYMTPLSKLVSFMFGGSATLSESRDHTFTDNFQLSMRKLYADAQLKRNRPCPDADTNLARPLGIAKFIAAGAQTPRLPLEWQLTACTPGAGSTGAGSTGAGSTGAGSTGAGTMKQCAPAINATQAFGGTIQFVVTKNLSGVGPTWTTTRWRGPGGLVTLSQVNTDKITLAFAQGPNIGTAMPNLKDITANGPNLGAYNFQQQQITQSINSQLGILLNPLP